MVLFHRRDLTMTLAEVVMLSSGQVKVTHRAVPLEHSFITQRGRTTLIQVKQVMDKVCFFKSMVIFGNFISIEFGFIWHLSCTKLLHFWLVNIMTVFYLFYWRKKWLKSQKTKTSTKSTKKWATVENLRKKKDFTLTVNNKITKIKKTFSTVKLFRWWKKSNLMDKNDFRHPMVKWRIYKYAHKLKQCSKFIRINNQHWAQCYFVKHKWNISNNVPIMHLDKDRSWSSLAVQK